MSLAGSNRKPALTAAASKIGFSRVTADKLKDEPWQDRAWGVYADLPEIFYMTRYRKDVAAQVEYFVATVDEPGADPNLDEGGRGAKVLQGEGGPELLRRIVSELVVHWDVPGEAHLVRFEEAPFWRVLSTQELKREGQSKTFLWGDETNQMGTIDRDNVYRVWDPHPRYHWQADSPVRHVLDNAEELILLTREAKARSLSRINAGTFWIPDGVDMSPFADDEEGTPDDFARELTNYMTRPLKDVGSASSLVPWIITANRDDIAAVRHITFERDWDINLELRRDLLRSVATGLDLPPEILTGMADLNHWSAWLVSEQAVSQHVLPTVDAILDSLTTNWFRPLLEASGLDPDLYVLWRDPSPATVPPDQSDVAIRLNELGVISDEATRRVTNFDDEDAPTPEELEAKAARKVATPEELPTDGPPDPIRAAVDPDFIAQVAEAVRRLQEGDPPLAEAAVTAAVRRRIVATELADIDAELLTWCQEKADAEIERLLGIVGKSLTAATDPLDESLLTRLAAQLDAKIAEAQAAARQWVESLTAKPIDPEPESAFRSQGIQVIIGGILEAVRRRLFTPGASPDPIDTGRIPTVTTPTAAIRQGLSLAGGGPAVYEDGKTSELVGNGQHIHDELEDEGFFQDGYEWKYGHPANTFEPHLHLDGKQFTSWDDPQLAVNFGDSWLRRSHYAPGDHKGCCCAFIQVIIKALPAIEGRETLPGFGGVGIGGPLTSGAGTLPGKSYAYTLEKGTGKFVKRTTLKRRILGTELVPAEHLDEVTRRINEVLDAQSPEFRVPTIEFSRARSSIANIAEYDQFGVVAGGKDKMVINVNSLFDDAGNWRPEKQGIFSDVIAHENAHRIESLASSVAPEAWSKFEVLANQQMHALSDELADVTYVLADSTQMTYPVLIVRRMVGGSLAEETFSEVVAFARTDSLGFRWVALRDAAQEVIDDTFEFLNP